MNAERGGGATAWYCLILLTMVNIVSVVDRTLPAVLIQQIKADLHLSDAQFGLINGAAFTLVYCLVALPLSHFADRKSRKLIITGSLAFWSLMTMAGAASRSFLELAMARVGLAVGEGGFLPSAQSFISDRFDQRRRGLALSILMAGSSIGVTVGLVFGGFLGAAIGWRLTMVAIGACGLIFAVLFAITITEPSRTKPALKGAGPLHGIFETLRFLVQRSSFRHIAVGSALYSAFSTSAATFTPGFLMRSFGFDMVHAGTAFGLIFGGAGIMGILLGGYLGDKLGARDPRWIVWVPAIGLAISGPTAIWGYLETSSTLCLILLFIPKALGPLFLGTCYGLVHRMAGEHRKATSSAILMIMMQGIGASLGPWTTGQVSDWFTATFGTEALRHALACVSVVLIWASLHFALAARSLRNDLAKHDGNG